MATQLTDEEMEKIRAEIVDWALFCFAIGLRHDLPELWPEDIPHQLQGEALVREAIKAAKKHADAERYIARAVVDARVVTNWKYMGFDEAAIGIAMDRLQELIRET